MAGAFVVAWVPAVFPFAPGLGRDFAGEGGFFAVPAHCVSEYREPG